MSLLAFQVEVELGPLTLARLDHIAGTLDDIAASLRTFVFPTPTSLKLNLPDTEGGTMPFSYKADKTDFVARVSIQGVDSEGNTIADINIPTGMTLTVTTSDALGLTATQDPLDAKSVSYHVGEPNTDETPRPVSVTATLTRDADGSTVLTITDTGDVTVGDAVGEPTGLGLNLPTA